MNHGFSAAGDDAVAGDAVYHYHSIYDSFRWMELYGDPGFSRHVCVLPKRCCFVKLTGYHLGCGRQTFGVDGSTLGRLHYFTSKCDPLRI